MTEEFQNEYTEALIKVLRERGHRVELQPGGAGDRFQVSKQFVERVTFMCRTQIERPIFAKIEKVEITCTALGRRGRRYKPDDGWASRAADGIEASLNQVREKRESAHVRRQRVAEDDRVLDQVITPDVAGNITARVINGKVISVRLDVYKEPLDPDRAAALVRDLHELLVKHGVAMSPDEANSLP